MSQERITIRLLGQMELEKGDILIHEGDNRSKKSWLLLGYLLVNRNQKVTQNKLIAHLWGNDDSSINPSNALKTLFHRTRNMLNKLGEGTGNQFLHCRKGEYYFDTSYPYVLDIE